MISQFNYDGETKSFAFGSKKSEDPVSNYPNAIIVRNEIERDKESYREWLADVLFGYAMKNPDLSNLKNGDRDNFIKNCYLEVVGIDGNFNIRVNIAEKTSKYLTDPFMGIQFVISSLTGAWVAGYPLSKKEN